MNTFVSRLSATAALILVIATLSLPITAYAEQGLGMDVIGDENTDFGLMIAKWMDSETAGPLAPGLSDETILAIDPKTLSVQRAARRALDPLPR